MVALNEGRGVANRVATLGENPEAPRSSDLTEIFALQHSASQHWGPICKRLPNTTGEQAHWTRTAEREWVLEGSA